MMRRITRTILLFSLIIILTACSTAGSLTPKQLLDQTDLRSLIGQSKETIFQAFLLTDQIVLERNAEEGLEESALPAPDAGIFLLPFVQQPGFNQALANDEWAVELMFANDPSGTPVLCGFRLMAAYQGADAEQRAKELLQKAETMLSEEEPAYANEEIDARLVNLEPQEWTDIFETLGQLDSSYTHMVRITYRVPQQSIAQVEPLDLPDVIPENVYLRKTKPLAWLFREAGFGYILLFVAVGAAVLFAKKKWKKT